MLPRGTSESGRDRDPTAGDDRYAGKPHAWIVTSLIGHTTAHATQIRQFTDARGMPPPVRGLTDR